MSAVEVTDLKYSIVGQRPDTEFLGGTQTRDVVAVGVLTEGHGIYFETRIPASIYSSAQVKDYATGYTGTIESIASIPSVAGVQWTQVVTASQELQDALILTVTSDSGNSQAQITLLDTYWAVSLAQPKVNALVKQLNQAEALTG